ncbi:D-alanyl-D-alanine carboxypeptidase [Brasilonema sp. UFV-L1]|uniref:D-alanyl-D-alanine carboxypeptidase n=1 Tax=Brasilonema sp. UFV-L1 TaxID=2234130 RepID=UPI00145CB49F|nr:D-alanyl-D-alanine carboxypeptidase [Brasilonema sp. UFV-L1]NMG08509.1 D-alanyl-D-alanine carboxypeptidase [Brasilonema sp. UFV-L1]
MTFHFKNYAVLSCTLLALVSGCSINKLFAVPQASHSNDSATKFELTKVETQPKLSLTPNHLDKAINAQVQQYVKLLAKKGFPSKFQGVWIQSDTQLLAHHQGTVPLRAASLSKVATTLVALETLGAEHQFVTRIGTTGSIQNGVLNGDLIIEGAEDPFFVWEEAFKIGHLLNQLGIKRVTGNLLIVGKFYMNFKDDPLTTGNLLKVGLNSSIWSEEARTQYFSLPASTPKPQVRIDGTVQTLSASPSNFQPLVRHFSYPLTELLKKMNLYSNNFMADKLADAVGGAKVVAQKAALTTGVPTTEIQLVNGSGLAIENRISPRAVCAMFRAIEKYLQPHNMTVADVFTVAGQDQGILDKRPLPKFAVVKSGSFNNLSNLAGALPTQEQKTVWFVIMNAQGESDNLNAQSEASGKNLEYFRTQQDYLLQSFVDKWGAVEAQRRELTPNPTRNSKTSYSEIVMGKS